MGINKELKNIVLLIVVLSLGCGMTGAMLGIFAWSEYGVPAVTPQWLSRFDRLQLDSCADILVFEVEGHLTQTTNLIEAQAYTETVVFSISNDGDTLVSGTLTVSDTLIFGGDLDMSNNIIENIGAAGTDFVAGGSLQTAQSITVSSAGISVTGASTFNDDVDLVNNEITNIGAAGTDFQDDGGLITASTITVTAGGLVIVAGDLTLENDELIQNDVNGTVSLNIAGADEWDFTADQLDATNGQIVNIGAAGTDFGSDGSLTTAQTITVTAGGLAVVTGAFDVAAGATTVETMTVGVSGTGADVIFHGETAGEELTWDQSAMQLILDGVNGTTALDVSDGNMVVNDDLTVTAGAFDVTAGATTVETMTIGTDGTGADVILYSGSAGDYFIWDNSSVSLQITGSNATDALIIDDGNMSINDDLTVVAGAFDVTAGATTVETMTVGVDGGGRDVTLHSLAGSDLFLWDASAVCLDITGTAAQNALRVLDGNVAIVDDLDVDGTANLDVVDVDGVADFDSTVSISDTLDMTNDVVSNIGAAGTDFQDDGGLITAQTITVTAGGLVVSAGDIDGAGEFQVGTFLNLTAQTEISVTNGTVFTPTGSYQLIAAAAEVTPTVSTSGFTTGDLVELHNTETAVINFEASGTQLLKDDYPMDQYDVLGLRWNGTAWVELYRTGPRI